MAGFNAVLDTKSFSGKRIIDDRHPAIVVTRAFKADNGTIPGGELVAIDANDLIVSYNPLGASPENDPVGICLQDVDTTAETLGNILVHGTAVRAALTTGGSAAADEDVALLEPSVFAF